MIDNFWFFFYFSKLFYMCILKSHHVPPSPSLSNRPPLPPQQQQHHHFHHQHKLLPSQHVTNNQHQWHNGNVQRFDSFSSSQSPAMPSIYPHEINQSKPHAFMNQATTTTTTTAASTLRRPIPLPGNSQQQSTMPLRNVSASVFDLNQNGSGYPMNYQQQQQQQQMNQWGFTPVNQVMHFS